MTSSQTAKLSDVAPPIAAPSQRIRGVILDVDGTLINSNDAHARSWVDALAELDIVVSFAQVRPLIGMGGDKLLPALANLEEDSPVGQKLSQRRSEIFEQRYFPSVQPFPKVRELLERIRGSGMALGVATSSQKQEVERFLKRAQVEDLIEQATSSSDAQSSKPDPDIVQAALDRLELSGPFAVMIGDTPYDIEAAARAGIACIAFRSGGHADRDLAGAVAIYDGAADLLARFESSPLASGARRGQRRASSTSAWHVGKRG